MTGTELVRSSRSPAQIDAGREAAELTRLAVLELGKLARGVGDLHLGIANRVFGATGPGAKPARVVHDKVSDTIYTALREGAEVGGDLLTWVIPDRVLSDSPRGAAVIAAVNGLIGDALEHEGSPLAHPIRLIHPEVERTSRIVVFAHGLMESEFSWGAGGRRTYGERLYEEAGWTPVHVRYNSGRRVSRNGRELAACLAEELSTWPVPIHRIALVGHSMGGLVLRAACHYASQDGEEWVRKVSHVVSLGTPHLGAPLEQGVHHLAHHLARLPETRPISDFLRRRSGGIRDLRQGSLVDEDWDGRDPEALKAEACAEVPLLEGATHCFVSACVTRSPKHPVGRLIGDLLVLGPSASGTSKRRSIGLDAMNGLELGGVNHFALLNHPDVYAQLRKWLA